MESIKADIDAAWQMGDENKNGHIGKREFFAMFDERTRAS